MDTRKDASHGNIACQLVQFAFDSEVADIVAVIEYTRQATGRCLKQLQVRVAVGMAQIVELLRTMKPGFQYRGTGTSNPRKARSIGWVLWRAFGERHGQQQRAILAKEAVDYLRFLDGWRDVEVRHLPRSSPTNWG